MSAKGVEIAKQAAFLDQSDGDQAQGFFFGRPMPASEVGASILADFQKSIPTPPATPQEAKLRLVNDRQS
jgi:EAL domain-containing protein (putative c-di-GMP-specific phosphodiesterase class I)